MWWCVTTPSSADKMLSKEEYDEIMNCDLIKIHFFRRKIIQSNNFLNRTLILFYDRRNIYCL